MKLRAVSRGDRRPLAVAATIVLVAGGGWALQAWNSDPGLGQSQHAEAQLKAEVDNRFRQGVVMLHAKEFEHAMTAFHRVLQLAPTMPEAHVNIGFALIGMRRHVEAEGFFRSAIELRPGQANAYYGLAMALEGKDELPAALVAMQAYMHLSKPDDRHRRKGEAAVWEWQEILGKRTTATAAASGPGRASRRVEGTQIAAPPH